MSPIPTPTRATVVAILSKFLSIPPDEIATIGDMPNDVLMFRKSGLSIAMGNASPDVQNKAQFVTDILPRTRVSPRRWTGSSSSARHQTSRRRGETGHRRSLDPFR